jgi:hypothetical protein
MRLKNLPRDSSLFVGIILRRSPYAKHSLCSDLAELWSEQLEAVLTAMSEATHVTGRVIWPEEARAELALEMAKLLLFVSERVVDDRLRDRELSSIDPSEERAYFESAHGKERARSTGVMFAEHVWNRVYDEFARKYPLVLNADRELPFEYRVKKRREGRSPAAKRNHFLPGFAVKPWANSSGEILVFHHWVDGGVRASKRSYRNWGYEKFLYPQWLERYFHGVESDAADPYRRLLKNEPLPPDERRIFTTFLVVQMLRTPSFIARLGLGLRKKSVRENWDYPTNAGSLRRVYETLFENDAIHAELFVRLSAKRWQILRPSDEWVFPRVDSGIVIGAVLGHKQNSALFPLSPRACLCIGPGRANATDPPIPLDVQLDESQSRQVVIRIAAAGVRSVVLPPDVDAAQWSPLLSRYLGAGMSEEIVRYSAWGSLRA